MIKFETDKFGSGKQIKFSTRMWDVNVTAIYYLRSDNVLKIPCRNNWQYTKYWENYAQLCCQCIVILQFQKCMKQLPVKDFVCLSYSRWIHEEARRVLYNLFQANLHMNYFLENTYCKPWQVKRYVTSCQVLNIMIETIYIT